MKIDTELVAATDSGIIGEEEIKQEGTTSLAEESKGLERDEGFDVFGNRAGLGIFAMLDLGDQELRKMKKDVQEKFIRMERDIEMLETASYLESRNQFLDAFKRDVMGAPEAHKSAVIQRDKN
ncbi:hypothetical protein MMC28_002954 [Mycoblastus sanguinarius]|nr:hypothetical protein [Mycoblastus sanguinarius]